MKDSRLHLRITSELMNRIDAYCEKTGLKKTTIVEKSIQKYLDEAEAKTAK